MTATQTILIVDDEDVLVRTLQPTLEGKSYRTLVAKTGREAIGALRKDSPEAVLLDLGLPDIDGKELIREIRQTSQLPIIVLSARDSESEKIESLDLGANDYIPKPYSAGELLARLRAALRTHQPTGNDVFERKGLSIDFAKRHLSLGAQGFRLSKKEAGLLRVLVTARGNIVNHKRIITEIWGEQSSADAQHVRVLVMQLRQKLGTRRDSVQLVVSEPGLGYRLELPHNDW